MKDQNKQDKIGTALRNRQEDDYTSMDVASNTECTGMMYRPPVSEAEAENYEDIYSVPQQTNVTGQAAHTPKQQEKISSVRNKADKR